MITDIEFLKKEVKNAVTEKRYIHSLGVMKMCEKLANIYGADVERAKLVGLMHDLSKEMPNEEKLIYVKENNIYCTDTERQIGDVLHGKIAGDICEKKYGFDKEMCIAISIHTTGKEDMTLLQKVLFIADKIDETRKYEAAEELRNIAYNNLDEAILKNINDAIKKLIDENRLVTEESIQARNYLLSNRC